MGSRFTGNLRILNRERETNAVSASSECPVKVQVANVANVT